MKSLTSTTLMTAALVQAAKCPFGFDSKPEDKQEVQVKTAENVRYPSQLFNQRKATKKTKNMSMKLYKKIVNAVHDLYEKIPDTVEDNNNPRGKFVGCLLRTGGHDFMDFRYGADGSSSTGGMDACFDFDDKDNMGLQQCLTKHGIPELYQRFKKSVSLADFFVIIAQAAAGRTATGWDANNRWAEDTLETKFMNSFRYGRVTKDTCDYGEEKRMPNPENGCEGRGEGRPGLKQIFVDHIYRDAQYPWTYTTAISGAHTVGSASHDNSGYDGHWSTAKEQGKFNNDYYKSILLKGWGPDLAVKGNKDKNQWLITDHAVWDIKKNKKKDVPHKEIMLTTDMCLAFGFTKKHKNCILNGNGRSNDMKNECDANYLMDGPTHPNREALLGFEDLDPTKHFCCTWVAPGVANGGRYFKPTESINPSPEDATIEYCGLKYHKNAVEREWLGQYYDRKPGEPVGFPDSIDKKKGQKNCCAFKPPGDPADTKRKKTKFKDCSFKYNAHGVAYFDVADFAREEWLFYKYFVEAWTMANENGYTDDDLTCVSKNCKQNRFALQDKEKIDCKATRAPANYYTKGQFKGREKLQTHPNPACMYIRTGDAVHATPHAGIVMLHNWWQLSRNAIPADAQALGFDGYNYQDYFLAEFSEVWASSHGKIPYQGDKPEDAYNDLKQQEAPVENLLTYSKLQKQKREGKVTMEPTQYHALPHGVGDVSKTTCWASGGRGKDDNPEVELYFRPEERGQQIFAVQLRTLFDTSGGTYGKLSQTINNKWVKENLMGSEVWLVSYANWDDEEPSKWELCGSYAPGEKFESGLVTCQKNIKDEQTGELRYPKGDGVYVWFKDDSPNCDEETCNQLILCQVLAYKYNEHSWNWQFWEVSKLLNLNK